MNHEELVGVLSKVDLVAVEAGRRSAEIERARSLPRDLMDALIDTGVFRLAVPSGLGGFEAGLTTLLRAVTTCSYHDGSTGWWVMSGLLAGLDAGRLPRHHAQTLLGDAGAIVAGHRGQGGRGRFTDDGGLIVTGRWAWGTAVANSPWIGAGVRITDDEGQPAAGPSGEEEVHAFFRRDQIVVLDTWHALGLRGTGSTDFQVTEVFVPEGRWVGSTVDPPGTLPLHRLDQRDLMSAGVAAVAIGLAARAIDEVVAAGSRSPDDASHVLAERPMARNELARVDAALGAARCSLDRAVAEIDADPVATDAAGRLDHQLASATLHAIDTALPAVDRCHRLGGVHTVLHASLLQRLLRDAHVVAQHPVLHPSRWEELGRARFGTMN